MIPVCYNGELHCFHFTEKDTEINLPKATYIHVLHMQIFWLLSYPSTTILSIMYQLTFSEYLTCAKLDVKYTLLQPYEV